MTYVLLIAACIVFSLFFVSIGTPWIALAPLAFVVFFISNTQNKQWGNIKRKQLLEQNGLLLSRMLLMLGMIIIGRFFIIDIVWLALSIVTINLLARIVSYVIDYKDGQKIFHISYHLANTFLIGTIFYNSTPYIWYVSTLALIVTNFGVYGFISLIIWSISKVPNNINSITYLLSHSIILMTVYGMFAQINLQMFIVFQLYLFIVYYIHHHIKISYNEEPKVTGIDVKDILAWKKILPQLQRIGEQNDFLIDLYHRLKKISHSVFTVINFFNVIIILLILWYFFLSFRQGTIQPFDNLLYRICIALFIANFLILKKDRFASDLHRFCIFFVINFAIYLSIIQLSGIDYVTIALMGWVRNITNSIFILFADNTLPRWLIQSKDYVYRVIANIGALLFNLYFMVQLPFASQLVFGVVFIYLGIQLFLLFYNIKHIKRFL